MNRELTFTVVCMLVIYLTFDYTQTLRLYCHMFDIPVLQCNDKQYDFNGPLHLPSHIQPLGLPHREWILTSSFCFLHKTTTD